MFEKEAEEYANKVYGNRTEMDNGGQVISIITLMYLTLGKKLYFQN